MNLARVQLTTKIIAQRQAARLRPDAPRPILPREVKHRDAVHAEGARKRALLALKRLPAEERTTHLAEMAKNAKMHVSTEAP